MKIVSHKRINRVRIVSGRWTCSSLNLRNLGFGFAIKVTAIFLISCSIIAFQVATTLSSRSNNRDRKDVDVLIRDAQAQAQSLEPVSSCNECSESDSDSSETDALAMAIRDIANHDAAAAEANIVLSLELDVQKPSSRDRNVNINNDGKTTTTTTGAYIKESQNSEQLDNVFFSVKSTKRFHKTRLEPVLKTWFNLARDQTWIFTDDDDLELMEKTNGHVINTHCPSTHYRQALCCKMAAEFDTFIQTTKSWFCHFDDDNYVNVPPLLSMLKKYNSREFWYLGKPSLKSPIRIQDPDNHTEEVSFWFATGGAGFCLSRALALRMSPLASGGKFTKVCDRIQLPDDVTVGYIAGHLLGQNLTVIPQFHSHFETMKFIDMKNPSSEITFSYLRYPEYENVLEVDGFSAADDPTRFLSLHCKLFPNFSFCDGIEVNNGAKTSSHQRRRRRR